MTSALIELRDVHKSYGNVRALRGVDFALRSGEVHALLGANGAGKSTLIKVLAGVERPGSGRVAVGGRAVGFLGPADAAAAGIAVVHQELSLVPTMSVAGNLFLGREPTTGRGLLARGRMNERAREALMMHGLDLDPRTVVGPLRFSVRQRLEIVKALLSDANILVLDEPTAALTEAESQDLFDAVRHVVRHGGGVVYVSHRIDEVLRIADRVTVLRDGLPVGTYQAKDVCSEELISAIVGSPMSQGDRFDAGRGDANSWRAGSGTPVLELVEIVNQRLNGVSLEVHRGEVVGLVGVAGSGCVEVVEAVFGLRRLRSGSIRLDGRAVAFRQPSDAIDAGVALVPEDRGTSGLHLQHSIGFNVAAPWLRPLGRSGFFRRRAARVRAERAMRDLEIKAPGHRTPVKALSGGNQQKVVFAKWADPRPAVLLLIEPTKGVDVRARADLYRTLGDLTDAGTAVLVTSSDFAEMATICDRVYLVRDGQTVSAIADPAVIRSEHALHALAQGDKP